MSSYNQRSTSRVLRDNSMTNLVLVGDKALTRGHREPNIIDYHGPTYQHDSRRELTSPLYNITHMYTERFDGGASLGLGKGGFRTSPDSGKRGFFHTSPEPATGGFFHPPNRPASGVGKARPVSASFVRSPTKPRTSPTNAESQFSLSNQLSRPSSSYAESQFSQPNLLSRPTSTLPESQFSPPNLLSRPSSTYPDSQPVESGGKKQVRFEREVGDMLDIYDDPEYEPMTDVLSRLDEYTQNFVQEVAVAYTDCECRSSDVQGFSRTSSKIENSDDEDSGSDEEGDEEDSGIAVEVLLKTFHQYEEKGHSAPRQKAMMTLVETYISEKALSQETLIQLLQFLKNSVTHVQEACLVLLRTCVKNKNNVEQLLQHKLLDFLCGCLIHPECSPLRRTALLLMEGIFSCYECKTVWFEMVSNQLLPKLLSMLRGAQAPLDVKYAVCCVFRALAKHEEFIGAVTDNILPAIIIMRNSSAKFKEVYVEILTALLSQTASIPPDLVDSSALPVTVSIVSEGPCGPQFAALHLLTCLTGNDGMIVKMVHTNSLIPMVLCCMRESHCRRVRLKAAEVMKNLCTSRRIGLCKDLMLQLGGYLVPSPEPECLTSLSQMTGPPARPGTAGTKQRHDGERLMWLGLEKFVDMTKAAIFREAKVETDELGVVTEIGLRVSTDTSPVQLQLMTHAFRILQNVCLWPLDKSRLGYGANRVDLTHFTEDEKQRTRLSKVNRGLTQAVWDKVGTVVTHLLSLYGQKLTAVCKRLQKGKQRLSLSVTLEQEEVDLVTSLLELTLCSALCTCQAFPQIIADKGSGKTRPKSPQKLKSSSFTNMHSDKYSHIESQLKSQSDVGKSFSADTNNNKYPVKENQHLTNMRGSANQTTDAERSKAELLQHKEACTDRRLLRKCLFETGVFESVCPFLQCSEPEFQILVLQILRCLVQPLEERVAPKLAFAPGGQSSHGQRVRPQTAGSVQDNKRRLNLALCEMSPDLAGLIKEALGPQAGPGGSGDLKPPEGGRKSDKPKVVDIPKNSEEMTAIKRLEEFTSKSKLDTVKEDKERSEVKRKPPVINRCRPIAQQCRDDLIAELGENVIMGIFTKASSVRKHYVLLLHDLVHFGESETHMKLSTYGCMPRLIDFLRVNEDNELLEIIGLIMVRMLVSSDVRLKQLFNRHGGPQLLLSMAQYTTGVLKREVATTLKTVSKGSSLKKRPASAPASRYHQKQKSPDVWDHIQARWNQEDQVAGVLRQWIEADQQERTQSYK